MNVPLNQAGDNFPIEASRREPLRDLQTNIIWPLTAVVPIAIILQACYS